MYKRIKTESLELVIDVDSKIKNSKAYYSYLAIPIRLYTIEVVKRIGRNLTYLDGFSATGIMGIKLLKEKLVDRVIFNDLHTKPGLILHNILINNLSNREYSILNKNILKVTENIQNVDIIDLDPYGSPLIYLNKFKMLDSSYLFMTHTDLINICSHTCNTYYLKHNIIQYYSEAYNECAIRSILYLANITSVKTLNLFDVYKFNHYIRFYFKVLDKKGLTFYTGFICICGAFYYYKKNCVVCNRVTKYIYPVIHTLFLFDNEYIPFGFNKIEYSKYRKISVEGTENLIKILSCKFIKAVQSHFDKNIIKVSHSIERVVDVLDSFFEVNYSLK